MVLSSSFLTVIGSCSVAKAASKVMYVPVYEDLYVEQGYPDTLTYGQRNLYVGLDSYYGKQKTRIFLFPFFEQLQQKNIAPEQITAVSLTLYMYQSESDGDRRINLYTTRGNIDPFSLTWHSQPSVLDYYYSKQLSGGVGTKTIGVSSRFAAMYADFLQRGERQALVLKFSDETSPAWIFWSKECLAQGWLCNSEQVPRFRVEYKDNTVPEAPALLAPAPQAAFGVRDINFRWGQSTDPDGDPVEYKLEIAKSQDFQTIYKSTNWQTETSATIRISYEGELFWRVRVKDPYGNYNVSQVRSFTTDFTPPHDIEFRYLPPYISQDHITVKWYLTFPEEGVTYKLKYWKYGEPSVETDWLNISEYTLTNLTSGKYYIAVKARDSLGNESDYTQSLKLEVDIDKPNLEYFKASKTLFASRKGQKVYLQFKVSDQKPYKVEIRIYDAHHKIVGSTYALDKDYLSFSWPAIKTQPDGYYYAYGIAWDYGNRALLTDPILLANDNTAPKPEISGITQGLFNRSCFYTRFTCYERNAKGNVYIGNHKKYTFVEHLSKKLCFKDGYRTVRLRCYDQVGNSSEAKVGFAVDTTPPKNPTVRVYRQRGRTYLKVSCEAGAKVKVWLWGRLYKQYTCKSRSVRDRLSIVPYITYLFTAKQTDRAGNSSGVGAYKYRYVPPVKVKEPLKVSEGSCVWVYHKDKGKVLKKSCGGIKGKIVKVQQTPSKNRIKVDVYAAVPQWIKIRRVIYACKPRSFWDPRTWFMCVTYKQSEDTVLRPLGYKVHGASSVGWKRKNLLRATFYQKPSSKFDVRFTAIAADIKYRLVVFLIDGKWGTVNTIKGRAYARPYFSWLFSDTNVTVSQWHGYTAYQKPHTGIDFAVYKRQVYAPAEGKIISVGYHRASKCFGGGYYVGIKHPNGLYTYYFHLLHVKGLRRYQWVKRRSKLVITGNSGMYRCRPLGYHLHFEVRTCGLPKCHINPVPLIDVDWRKIKTAVRGRYWGRLTGDNPHPGY